MVKEPEEQFALLKADLKSIDKVIDIHKEMLSLDREARKKLIQRIKRLEKKWAK